MSPIDQIILEFRINVQNLFSSNAGYYGTYFHLIPWDKTNRIEGITIIHKYILLVLD